MTALDCPQSSLNTEIKQSLYSLCSVRPNAEKLFIQQRKGFTGKGKLGWK